ncbi:hypothetical protein EGR_03227 [Echinococcus granulosus]|uniref:Protein SDA1 n=1 Tax=Echinococcus granulosus TaxID=6210 RepID=W6V6F5_ECHGR|nr:hypothetical protein EGR_03227 [Echinococcus granulosus]EUB61954.1 hypothetical protein EGR_03227 [Echinococcus granulosus]
MPCINLPILSTISLKWNFTSLSSQNYKLGSRRINQVHELSLWHLSSLVLDWGMSATLIQSNLDELEGNIRRDPESYLPDVLGSNIPIIHLVRDSIRKLQFSGGHAYLKAFIRLRLRNFITLQQSVDVAFRLHRCQDKPVRKMLRGFVISDIKRTNLKNRPEKSNSVIQSFLASSIKDGNTTVAKEAVVVLVELYRRDVWKNEKSVNLIADACFAKSKKVYSKAVRFFLGHNEKSTEQGSSSDSDANVGLDTKIKQLKLGHRVGTKSKKRAKRLDRDIDNLKRKSERKLKKQKPMGINVPALNMIYDPQTFTEKLFHKLEKCNDRLEIRLLLLELISHLIGVHQLLLLNFYPSLQRFLRPQQREITRLLLFAAEASHDQVPPDVRVHTLLVSD